jgi:hypothetical protein
MMTVSTFEACLIAPESDKLCIKFKNITEQHKFQLDLSLPVPSIRLDVI